MKTHVSFLAVSLIAALAACGGSDTTNPQPTGGNSAAICESSLQATFSDIHSKVLVPHCAGCHGAGSPRGAFADSNATAAFNALKDVTPNNSAANGAGLKRVLTGDSAKSLLVWKLDPANLGTSTYGATMPIGANPSGLCAQNLTALKQWIDGGAQNN